MAQVRWDGGTEYELVLEGHSSAAPAEVYDLLSDPSTYLDWSGAKQAPGFRLIAVNAEGRLEVGSRFTSVGTVPMTRARSEDSSEVIQARRPEILEFVTDMVIVWRAGKRTEARFEHRYTIEPDGEGSRVVYRLRGTAVTDPPPRATLPLMRTMTHRFMMPMLYGRGFANALKLAGSKKDQPAKAERQV
jgi:uncharacterized protein YndB with AHSA1/START domain